MTASALLQWLLSQSIFVLPLEQIDKVVPEILISDSLYTVNGFSVWAIVISHRASAPCWSNLQLVTDVALLAMALGIILCIALCIYGCKSVGSPIM